MQLSLDICHRTSMINIASVNGLVPSDDEAITWTTVAHDLQQHTASLGLNVLTNWSRVMHICVSTIVSIGSDNGLSPDWHQAIIWTIAGILSTGPSVTNFNYFFIKIHFPFKKIHLKMWSGKWWPFCLGLNVLTCLKVCLYKKSKNKNRNKAQLSAAEPQLARKQQRPFLLTEISLTRINI